MAKGDELLLDYDYDIKTLQELGLTLSQAKVYVAAAKLGRAKAKDLWEKSGVGRQELYRILTELLDAGLVQKEISTPTHFLAEPFSKGVLILLNRKRKEIFELERKSEQIMLRNPASELKEAEVSKFCILSRKHLMDNKGKSSYENSAESIDYFCPFIRLIQAFAYNISVYADAVERGVRMRVITEKLDDRQIEELKKQSATLLLKEAFKVRFVTPFDNMAISIIDGKEAYFSLYPDKSLFEDQLLWSNSEPMITLAEKYFEMIWKSSAKIETFVIG